MADDVTPGDPLSVLATGLLIASAGWRSAPEGPNDKTGDFRMPYYSFDLVIGEEYKSQGGLILENLELAADLADQLAVELSIVRPELKAGGCAVRVISVENIDLYRTPLDPIPSWMRCQNLSVSRGAR